MSTKPSAARIAFVVVVTSAALALIAGEAAAQPPPIAVDHGRDDYGYFFTDDPLTADTRDGRTALIRVTPHAARVTLIRPRLSFVQELIKSVETF